MSSEQMFQEEVVIEKSRTRIPRPPFKPHTPVTSEQIADLLENTIPGLGAEPLSEHIASKEHVYRVEEQYRYVERRAFPTSTTPNYYDIVTPSPKEILIVSETVDIYVDFNQQIDTSSSMKVFAGGSLSMTARGITRIWYQAVSGTGTIRILIQTR